MQVAANTACGGGYWTFYPKKYAVSKFIDNVRDLVRISQYSFNNSLLRSKLSHFDHFQDVA